VNLLVGTLSMGLLLALATLGLYIALRVLHTLDLTVEGSFGLGAALSAALLARGASPLAATAAAVAGGVLAGATSGLMHTRGRIDTLLAGILTSTALYSVMLYLMGGGDLSIADRETLFSAAGGAWERLGGGAVTLFGTEVSAGSVASLVFLAVLVPAVALALGWFFRTRLGLAARAAGDSPTMARAQGVSVGGMLLVGLTLSNGLVGLSGALFAQYQGFASVQMGIGTFVTALACLILGEALFGRTRVARQLAGAVVGTMLFRLLVSAALQAGLDPNALKLATAAFVLAVLVLQGGVKQLVATALGRHARGG
jgi:putative tryptophan/tyrosine transport system permease protein